MAGTLIFYELLLSQGACFNIGKVLIQSIDDNGKFVGNHNENTLLNNHAYDVELQDGAVKKYGSNIIAEKIISQCNPDGFYRNVL